MVLWGLAMVIVLSGFTEFWTFLNKQKTANPRLQAFRTLLEAGMTIV